MPAFTGGRTDSHGAEALGSTRLTIGSTEGGTSN
jgi:hypothetical protein